MSNLVNLNERQLEAVQTTEGPLLIIAGAGSGKTRVLTNRTAYLIDEKNVNPYHIMAITFTNKAAQEMKERIQEEVGFGAEQIWVTTFHSTCVRILRRFIERLGYGSNFTIYDSDDQKNVMKDVIRRLELDPKKYKERTFLNIISSAKDELIDPITYATNAVGDFNKQRAAQIYREYQETLKKNNALDFDDLIVKTVELFKTQPDVLDYYQERFQYIMVDEYQDTNTAQFELVRLLASKYHNLCVVGDDDQSIYKFRGANIYNILNFEKHFADAKVIKLEQNYRSTQNILDAANAVIRNNRGRKEKSLWTDQGTGDLIQWKQFDNAYEEAEYIAHDIARQVREENINYSDCAVLYRTNAQSRLFEERFIQFNIPYKIVGGVNFYSRKEIKDVLAYLKTIDNGQDDLAVKRIINVPKRGIGATTIGKVENYAMDHGLSFFDALTKADEIPGLGKAASKIKPFVSFIQVMRAKMEYEDLAEFLEEVLEESGYLEDLEAEETDESKARLENIDELISKAAAFEEGLEEEDEEMEEGARGKLSRFLEEVALVADIDSLDEESDYVVLMTLHSAKGLEFPHVYLSGMEDGLFPSYMSIASDDPTAEIEEERRLCYVGITRAKKRLTISAARSRMVRGEMQFHAVSRFVKEIPREYLQGELRESKTEQAPKDSSYFQAKKTFQAKPYAMNPVQPARSFASANTEKQKLDYQVGDRVRHMKFGEGTVLAIVEGGRDFEVTVEFDQACVKKMFAIFAKLQKI